jgi:hypothetical protein
MAKRKWSRAKATHAKEPDWQPLLNLLARDFMWMFTVDLKDGRKVQVYKHYWTRGYLHLSEDGAAFVYNSEKARYEEVDPERLLEMVLYPDGLDKPFAFELDRPMPPDGRRRRDDIRDEEEWPDYEESPDEDDSPDERVAPTKVRDMDDVPF